MAKKVIGIGTVVDDFTGDYLRKGGQKINSNFDEIYEELGDNDRVHSAGAFRTFIASPGSNTLNPQTGESWHIDSTLGPVTVNLPLIDNPNEGRVIKISDIHGSWHDNTLPGPITGYPVTVFAAVGNTIKSFPSHQFVDPYQIVTFVQTEPEDWKFVDGVFHDRYDATAGSVQKLQFVIPGDTDPDGVVTGIPTHNEHSVNVYLNGALLSYDSDPGALADNGTSEYGSSLTGIGNELTPLNTVIGQIQLRPGIYQAGDILIIEVFSGTFSGVTTSYERRSRRLVSAPTVDPQELYVASVVGNEFQSVPLLDFGISDPSLIKPSNFQFFYNGVLMTEAGSAGFTGNNQYRLVQNLGVYNEIWFTAPAAPLYGTDIVTAVYFNNVIGTLLDLDDIKTEGDNHWVQQNTFSISNLLRYNSYFQDPITKEIDTRSTNATISTAPITVNPIDVFGIMELLYPVGTVYENATNPNNPKDYLGFGTWAPFAVGKSSVGFDSTNPDLDEVGVSVGASSVTLAPNNIPELLVTPQGAVLFNDASGDVDISECLPDPSAPVANPASLSLEPQYANQAQTPDPINTRTPSIVTYKWVRYK